MYVCGVALGVGYVYMLGMHVFGESVLYVYVYLVWECCWHWVWVWGGMLDVRVCVGCKGVGVELTLAGRDEPSSLAQAVI